MQFVFSQYALKQFKKFPESNQNKIKEKLFFWQNQENSLYFAKRLINFDLATHRFRIGDYRLLAKLEDQDLVILILKVGHRKDVYR